MKHLNALQMRKAQEVFAKEEVIAAVVEEETRLERRLLEEKEANVDRLKEMERELVRLDRKELIHEKGLID